MGTQLAFEANPTGGRVSMVQMRAFSVKAFASVLFFEGSFRKPDVGLRGHLAFF
jgi:hypothetical protein